MYIIVYHIAQNFGGSVPIVFLGRENIGGLVIFSALGLFAYVAQNEVLHIGTSTVCYWLQW